MSKALITRNALAASLKELTATNLFDKITIADITGNLGLNRQTFYYHFADKLELLYWIYDSEAFVITCDLTINNWGEKLNLFLKHLRSDKMFYVNTIKCSKEYFEQYLDKTLEELFKRAAIELDENNELDENETVLVAKFMSKGLTGVIIEWIRDGMKENEDDITSISHKLVENTKRVVYKQYVKENK